ncbi:MAG: undecaprenyl-diphosphatase UppP [Solirubrobacterales bacterium]|nr:undecaprenyl-diphosphatase UppP [Solirubrobacterales bacterium]
MSILEAILLGIVQGLTEFLPISSSGHLILVPWAQDYSFLRENPNFNKTFDVALHLGTLIGVVYYFRRELWAIILGFFRTVRARAIEDTDGRLAWVLIIGTIPAVIVGGLGEGWIDDHLGEPWMIGIQLIAFGLLLGAADRLPQRKRVEGVTLREGLVIGVAQALSLAPGTSRSGITITAGRFLGLTRDAAARISFLLLVPATAGAVLLKGYQAIGDGLPDGVAGPMVAGVITSAVSGYLAIFWLLRFVRTRSYDVFVVYRVIVGVAVLAVIAAGVREATF